MVTRWVTLGTGITVAFVRAESDAAHLRRLADQSGALAGRLLFWIWPDRRRRDHWSRWQRLKYLLLVGLLVMALCGSHWGTIFDPLVLLYRTTTTAILPAAQCSVQAPSTAIYHYDPETAPAPLRPVVEPVHSWTRDYVSEPVCSHGRQRSHERENG